MKVSFVVCNLIAVFACFFSFASDKPAVPFADGARYGAIGDSITHNGWYPIYLDAFYRTRYPERTIQIYNFGISGDSAGGVLGRYVWDIAPHPINTATVMLGMNDVGRDLYQSNEPDAEILKQRQARIDGYERNMRRIVDYLVKKDVQVTLITPSIFDDSSSVGYGNRPGVNEALGECARLVQVIAQEYGIPVIDVYGPMQTLNAGLQSVDPSASVVGKDRIHPGGAGHLAMTYWMLKAQGVSGTVSFVDINAASRLLVEAENCRVEDLHADAESVSFTYSAGALPFPVDHAAAVALEWVPFVDELNREIFKVAGLDDGEYVLKIDGNVIRTYTATELAHGVNIAMEANTPQFRQSQKLWDLCTQRGKLVQQLRSLVMVEIGASRSLPRPVTLEQIEPLLEARLQAAQGKAWEPYIRKTGEQYLNDKPLESDMLLRVSELEQDMREIAVPETRRVSIVKR